MCKDGSDSIMTENSNRYSNLDLLIEPDLLRKLSYEFYDPVDRLSTLAASPCLKNISRFHNSLFVIRPFPVPHFKSE